LADIRHQSGNKLPCAGVGSALVERQTRSLNIPATFFSGSLDEDDRFSSELETACFRIVQEAVTNIVRHARATRISVRLERGVSDLVLLITDDGAASMRG
jgi:signal transduction histidine kinase